MAKQKQVIKKGPVPKQLVGKNIQSSKRAVELGRRGGLKGGPSKSIKKSISAKLRRLKEKGLNDQTAERLYDIMMQPECSALKILEFIQEVQLNCGDAKEQIALIKVMNEWHKVRHGSKDTSKIIINNNTLNMTLEQKEAKILMLTQNDYNKEPVNKLDKE